MKHSVTSLKQTEAIAKRVLLEAMNAKAPFVVFLHGDIGAGKTEFVRLALLSYGLDQVVQSPTYNLYYCYQLDGLNIIHADLYRLSDPDELRLIGWDEVCDSAQVIFVEWPEQSDLKPTLSVCITSTEKGRQIEILSHN